MSTREPIYGDWSRPGWTCTGYNEYVYARDGIVVAHLRATHRRAYLDGVKYQSFMEAVHAAEAR